jgi:hypothetical protein
LNDKTEEKFQFWWKKKLCLTKEARVFFHQEFFQASREIAIKSTRKLLLQESKQ